MIREIAKSLGIDPLVLYWLSALIFLAAIYSYDSRAGFILAILAVLGILATDWNKK